MASGLPVAARDVPGVRDLVTDGVEGFVVGDGPGLAAALARLAGDAGLRAARSLRARARALAFTGPKFAERAIPFYEAVLGVPGAPSARSESRTS